MPDPIVMIWHGLPQLQTKLTTYTDRISVGVRNGVMLAARAVEAGAKREAPVRQRGGGGTLRRSIGVEGPFPTGVAAWRAMVGPRVVYGRRVELGFYPGDGHQNGVDRLGRQFNQRPNRYMQRGLEKVLPSLKGIIEAAITEATAI